MPNSTMHLSRWNSTVQIVEKQSTVFMDRYNARTAATYRGTAQTKNR